MDHMSSVNGSRVLNVDRYEANAHSEKIPFSSADQYAPESQATWYIYQPNIYQRQWWL